LTEPNRTLGRLLGDLAALLRVRVGTIEAETRVSDVVLYDSVGLSEITPDAIVLGIGIRDTEEDALRVETLAAAGAAALVIREPLAPDGALSKAAEREGIPLLGLTPGASWAHLTVLLTTALGTAETAAGGTYGSDFGGPTDLFSLANTVADLLNAPVTIEDPFSRVLAFSMHQLDTDEGRLQTILGRRVPRKYEDRLRERGVLEQLRGSSLPIYIEQLAQEIKPRVAVAVRGGDEYLASIWAVVSGPPSAEFTASMIEAARIIALRMLTNRELATDASRLRARNVDALIQGGASARQASVQLGLPTHAICVLAVALRRDDAGSPDAEEALGRVHAALNMHVGTVHPRAAAALVGRTIYVVLPLLGEEDQAALRARAAAVDIVERIGARIPVIVGVGDVVADVAQLSRSRAGADTALRVLASVGRRSYVGSVATATDVQVEALLLRLADAIASEGGTLVGPLATLLAYDDQHKTDLVATLNAWLDAFGDLATVASSMHVHPNTLRYRLRRVSEITGTDLSDPETRLGIMLQLRLFPLRFGGSRRPSCRSTGRGSMTASAAIPR
jgi:hypothetical protein